jgi:hypothetical protein
MLQLPTGASRGIRLTLRQHVLPDTVSINQ